MSALQGWKPDWAERIQRGRTKAFAKGYAKGYLHGTRDARRQLIDILINDILDDAVLQTNLDVDHLERIIEIIDSYE